MRATQSGSNSSASANFSLQFDQAHTSKPNRYLPPKKNYSMLLNRSTSTGSRAPNQRPSLPLPWPINSRLAALCPICPLSIRIGSVSACNDASRIVITSLPMFRSFSGLEPVWLRTARAVAERNQPVNRSGLRAARQINHWRRHGESDLGWNISERSRRSSDWRTVAIGRNAGSAC